MRTQIILLFLILLICLVGVLTIYSSTLDTEDFLEKALFRRQISWILLGLIFFLFFSYFPYRKLADWTPVLYSITLLLLFLVILLGSVRMGAQRWLKILWLNFQPSELAKLVMVIFLARYFSYKSLYAVSESFAQVGLIHSLILPFLATSLPMFLIFLQPDLGTSLIIFFIFLSMLYFAQVRWGYLLSFLGFLLACLPFFWHFLKDYQKERLMVFLDPNIDPLGAGYTIIQSKIAVGSGGFLGRGWLSGTQSQLHFLPEAHTDFIFSTFAEEWGFLGVCVLLLLYGLLLKICIEVAQKENNRFGKLLACGITAMLGMQIFINIAMTIGLAPVVGIPLPLMSYGGSALFINMIALGIISNIERTRSVF